MRHDSDSDFVQAILCTEEGAAHLLRRMVGVLGGSPQWGKDLESRVRSLQLGFQELTPIFPAAAVWSRRLQHLLQVRPSVSDTEAGLAPLHPVAIMLARQPSVTTRHEVAAAAAVGALVFYALYRGSTLSQNFQDSLKQFYTSSADHWENCRRSFRRVPDRLLSIPEGNKEVVRAFADAICSLQACGMYAPIDLDGTFNASNRDEDLDESGEPTAEQATEGLAAARAPTRFYCEPNFELMQFQIIQEEREPSLGQYRLLNDPNSLTEEEHREFWGKIHLQLRPDAPPAKRLHAAARGLSELCQLSLEVLASTPFADVREKTPTGFKRGSLHIDLRVGQIRRDFLTVAPRADRDRARTHGRYLRTPIPPQILQVLRDSRERAPTARTVGDLLQAADLTPTICHALANEGRTQPRPFTSLRIARSLGGFLLRKDVHPSIVAHTTGDITLVPRAHHYYLSLDQQHVYRSVNIWCSAIGLDPVPERLYYRRLGSPNFKPIESIRCCISDLQQKLRQARNNVTNRSSLDALIAFHNTYICSITLQITWALGARCQMLSSLSVGALLSKPDFLLISDRSSDRYSEIRLCVTTPVLRESLLGLAEHLRVMGHRLMKQGETTASEAMLRLVSGGSLDECAVPLLFWKKAGVLSLRAPTRADVRKIAYDVGMPALNTPRHFILSEFVERNVDAVAIDAQLGHHLVAAPPFGVASGLTAEAFKQTMEPVLTNIHDCMGLQPMVGLSNLQKERWQLPQVRLGDQIDLPQNTYLRQSVDVADFNPPDMFLAEQDCPWSWSTLAAHSEQMRLRKSYLRTDLLCRLPHGAALFCLASFDGIFSARKAQWVLKSATQHGLKHLGDLHVVEQIDSSVTAQVFLHPFTADALKHLPNGGDWEKGVQQLKELLCLLDEQWSRVDENATVARLFALAAHAAHLETAPIERFSLVHKAPFIPFADLQRMAGGLIYRQERDDRPASSPRRLGVQYAAILNVLDYWADHDERRGERVKRVKGALYDFEMLSKSHHDFDERLAIDWMRRELSAPPLRQLSFATLRAYFRLVLPFFQWVRVNERRPFGVTEWMEIRESLFKTGSSERVDHREDKESSHRRWAWQHIAAFIVANGMPVPRQVLFRPLKGSFNYRPHLHAYVTRDELEAAVCSLPPKWPPYRDWIIQELIVWRQVPMRPQEVRYLKADHLSPSGEWLLVTTSGHDHLKNNFARGLLHVPQPLRADFLTHMARRRAARDSSNPSAFVLNESNGYEAYDTSQSVARDALRRVSGRMDLRLYDLRASSITDLIAEPEPLLRLLIKGSDSTSAVTSTRVLHTRGAVAAREARHSNVITTLRYYHLGGLLGARAQMNRALASLKVSGIYLAAVHGVSRDVVYTARFRGRPLLAKKSKVANLTPQPENSSGEIETRNFPFDHFGQHDDLSSRLHAGALILGNVPPLSAADRAAADPHRLGPLTEYFNSLDPASRLNKSLVLPRSDWNLRLPKLAGWAAAHAADISQLLSTPEVLRFRPHNVVVLDANALCRIGDIWQELRSFGVAAVFSPARTMTLSERAHLEPTLLRHGVLIGATVTRERVGRLSFSLVTRLDSERVSCSGHVVGKTTRLIAHLMRMVINLRSYEKS